MAVQAQDLFSLSIARPDDVELALDMIRRIAQVLALDEVAEARLVKRVELLVASGARPLNLSFDLDENNLLTVNATHDNPRKAATPRELCLTAACEALDQSRQEAVESRNSRTALIANISHEIRTPMSGIMGLTEILIDDLDGEQKDMAEHIHEAASMLLKIVNDLLDIAKLENGTVHLDNYPFNARELISDLVTECRCVAVKKNIEIRENLDFAADLEYSGDPARIRQILLNIVLNAIKFTDHGHISVHAAVYGDGEKDLLTATVSDTGCGMSKGDLDRIFKPFIQVDGSLSRRHGGTGLGLALCRHLVELMGGEISVESDVGKGSTFTFYVPLESTTVCSSRTTSF